MPAALRGEPDSPAVRAVLDPGRGGAGERRDEPSTGIAGHIAQRRSTGLIIPPMQVRLLLGPVRREGTGGAREGQNHRRTRGYDDGPRALTGPTGARV